jgi:O-antigen ligase
MLKDIFLKRKDESIHSLIYFYSICLLLIALPTSIYLVSVSQIIMGANWFLEGHYREKIKRFSNNYPAIILSSIYLIYLLGILWTQDLSHGLGNELLDKLPFATLTFTIASSRPLSRDRLNAFLVLFSIAVIFSSFVGLAFYATGSYVNIREISPFIMHVYFSIMVVWVIFLLPWLIKRFSIDPIWFKLSLIISFWLILYLLILGSVTGILCLAGVVFFMAIRELFQGTVFIRKILIGITTVVFFLAIIVLIFYVVSPVFRVIEPDPTSLTQKTIYGSDYHHFHENDLRENGHLVYYFISHGEVRAAWNERSEMGFDSTDLHGHRIRDTLFRYLSSKGLRKDREGVESLSAKEIEAIEHGVPNYHYLKWPNALIRIHQTFWELYQYRRTGLSRGLSFIQRVELWRAAWEAYKVHPFIGWGTGDIFVAMEYGLLSIDSSMIKIMKPHNQFLSIIIQVGLIGFILISGILFLFIRVSRAYTHLPFNILFIIFLIGLLGANLLDFQIGLTFFLFYCLFFGVMLQGKTS